MDWWQYQSMQQVTQLGERFVSYIDQGTGPPVVLLHGFATWGYLWSAVAPALANNFRVLIPDLPGYGFSDKSDRFDRSIAAQAEVIDQWMQKIGVSQAHFVGHDIGGGVALRMAIQLPTRVQSMCLLDAVCYDNWPQQELLQLGVPDAYNTSHSGSIVDELRGVMNLRLVRAGEEWTEALLAPYSTEIGRLAIIRGAVSLNTNQTQEIANLLSTLHVPTLLLWGEDNSFVSVRWATRLAWTIPGARLVTISDAGHFMMLDQPEAVARHLLVFLRHDRQMAAAA